MLKYFVSILVKRIPIIFAITAVFLVLAIVLNNVGSYVEMKFVDGIITRGPKKGLFLVYTYGLGIISFVLPIIEYSFKMVRIQAQQAYSFPIKRGNLFLARYLVGIIEIFISFTVSYFVSVIFVLNSNNLYNTDYFFIYYPIALAGGILLFTFFSFIFCRANNILDGIVSMILAFLAPFSLGLAISTILTNLQVLFTSPLGYTPLSVLFFAQDFCEAGLVNEVFMEPTAKVCLVSIWAFIELLLVYFNYFFNQRIKTEDITNPSRSIFCYTLFLPMVSVGFVIYLTLLMGFWAAILVSVFSVGIFVLSRRGDMGKSDSILLICLILVIALACALVIALKGAGVL